MESPKLEKIKIESPAKQSEEVLYECSICNKDFRTPQGVKRHINIFHTKEQPASKDELTFSLCFCCGEPSDSAHTVS